VTSGPPSAKRRRSFAARHFVTSLGERAFSDPERWFRLHRRKARWVPRRESGGMSAGAQGAGRTTRPLGWACRTLVRGWRYRDTNSTEWVCRGRGPRRIPLRRNVEGYPNRVGRGIGFGVIDGFGVLESTGGPRS
jgi:hypothetical protein